MNITMKSLDTLKIYERFKKAETSDAQARELAEILRELSDDQLASKNDLENSKNELKNDLEKFKLDLEAKIELSKSELRAEIEKSQNELKLEIEKTNAKISQAKVEIIKWVIGWVTGLIIAQTGILVAIG